MRVLTEGTQLAQRYSLRRQLGAGGMAETWLASDSRSDSNVVLKFLAAGYTEDARYRDLLHREWRIGSNLMHAHIVRVFEFHDDPDGAFYSLQYIGDADIGVLAGEPAGDVLPPIALIADALRYAHAKGLVHRDVKASNILLDANGAPYLVDFGIAATAGDTVGGGSPIGASPEQLAGEGAQPADDIYALGVLIHELLTGAPPDRSNEQGGATLRSESLPSSVSDLLEEMLADDVALRPTAEQVAERLAAAGFAPGAAPKRLLPDIATAPQETVEAIQPVRREFRPALTPATPEVGSGISPKTLYGALATALVLLLGVVFLLPTVVERDPELRQERAVSSRDAGDEPDAAAQTPASEEPPAGETSQADSGADAENFKIAADDALGELLSKLGRLQNRAIDRWGGQAYLDAVDLYSQGDEAYVARNYARASELYREASERLDPFFDSIDQVFEETLAAAKQAFEAPDPGEAVRLYDLAVAITPGHPEAKAGLERSLTLESVLDLTTQGNRFEKDLEFDAAKTAFQRALELDPLWQPAAEGLDRVQAAIKEMTFDMHMSEGLEALAAEDFASARAAFNAAKSLDPTSRQPLDGLLQVDQGIRLANIRRLEGEAEALVADEQWEASIGVYEEILGIDPDLQFAKEGLAYSKSRAALHNRLQALIDDPDTLSDPVNMQTATRLLLDVARVSPMGPRLEDQKNELSRLLKRAARPLTVQLVSDNATEVAIYKVGKLGTFNRRELELVPGMYVAVGNRPGYRDVRLEFRVAPEIDMQPIVIKCEEPI
ncbi:MAG: serine/threonine-protein kinase [Woeseiaceae bacterium]|nr:serine/threonine-protein kinase [Woeseiaceae bacterium]